MHATPRQRVQIGREGRDKGLALTGLHLGNVTLVQENTAHQLGIKGPQTQRTLGGLTADGERFGQQRVKAFAIGDTLFELSRFGDDARVVQRLELGL